MARINENYLKLKAGYLFPEIGRRVAAFQKQNPDAKVIKLGIGDVTRPLDTAAVPRWVLRGTHSPRSKWRSVTGARASAGTAAAA